MQTLLEKVQTIEQEASELIHQAEIMAHQQLTVVLDREEHVIADIRAKAERKAQSIIQEHIQKVGSEINFIKQESDQAAEMVHKSAEQNRSNAIARARQLFEAEYLNS